MVRKIQDIYKKLIQVLTKRQKILFWFVVFAALISAIFETLGVSIVVPLVNALLTPEKLFELNIMQPFISFLSITNNKRMAIFILSATITLYLIKNAYAILFSWIKAKYASKVQRELSVYMMTSYMNRGYSYFLDKNTNQIQQGIVWDVQGVYNIMDSIIYSITKLLMVTMIGIYMIFSDWMIAGTLMVVAGACLIIIMICFKKPLKEIGEKLREYTIDSNQVLLQAIQGMKEVIVMRKQRDFAELYKYYMLKRQKEDIKRSVSNEAPTSIIEATCITAIMIIMGARIVGAPNPANFIAVLASFAVGAFRIMPAVSYLSSSINNIIVHLPGLNSVYENIVESKQYNIDFNDIDVKDKEEYKSHQFDKEIAVEHLTFSYKTELGNVLENISFKIQKNQSVGLVGESGAGKSTLADIILGILSPNEGSIMLDGINILDIPNLWSRLIGFVPQTIYLCDNSIAENVAFGEAEEKIDEKKVRKALQMANVLEFVDTLPQGIYTKVGDRGVRLSGGQRQRIGIARALYHEPEILILDEATSALDTDTERSVMEAIDTLQGNMTMIIIAHRLTTIKNCDAIYEIVNKGIVERKYEELVNA